ncbi:MAG TPA: DUF4169 family protein [Azospirillaceae bacterium]|nr:DUF4169 family protein [Azospirillaceae bacterium]
MGEVVNLNRFRKAKQRAEREATAAENRAKHGRTKAEREREALLQDKARKELEAKRIETEE